MERNRLPRAIAMVLLVGVAACSGQDSAANGSLDDSAAVAAPAAAAPDTTAAPAAAPMEGGATVTVANSPEYGSYLADGQGRALYLFTSDKPGESSCSGACAQSWPPYMAPQGTPTAGSAEVQASMLTTLKRADGSMQVMYNQHPLYYYHKDTGPGTTTGQDVTEFGGEWYLVTPQGEKLEKEEAGEKS